MIKRLFAGFLALALGIVVLVSPSFGQGGAVSQSYTQTFDGMPSTPAAYRPLGWDIQTHSRDNNTWGTLEPMIAQHGPACEAPPATHTLTGDYPSALFQCHDHLMTAIYAEGYGVIYLTPPALLDWSSGSSTLAWDMSTLRTSSRDWVDVWISPYAEHLALPLDDWLPDLGGEPFDAIHLRLDTTSGQSIWVAEQIVNGVATGFGGQSPPVEALIAPNTTSAVRRDTHRIDLTPTHLKFSLPSYSPGVFFDLALPTPLTWTQGIVQFGHHSYNPQKDCLPVVPAVSCDANTWHWDTVSLSPSSPLSITPVSPRAVGLVPDPANQYAFPAAPFTWSTPAVPGSHLEFAANSTDSVNGAVGLAAIELSWDGGATYSWVYPQWSDANTTKDASNARSYWVPIPTGATNVWVRGHGNYGAQIWVAQDAYVYPPLVNASQPTLTALPSPSPTTLVPTATNTLTAVPTIPTSTLTLVPTGTATATAVPFTFTPLPVATGTPSPAPLTVTLTALPTKTVLIVPPTVPPTGCIADIYRDGKWFKRDLNPQPTQCR